MDPFTGGIVLTGVFGGTLVGLGLLENAGVKINNDLLCLSLEVVKFGSLLYLLKVVAIAFL